MVSTPPIPDAVSLGGVPSAVNLRGSKVLIVDDDRLNLRILSRILQPEGFDVYEASSGEELLDRYATILPDLILLDVMMPGISGFETARELRNRYPEGIPPIVFITAKNEAEDIVEGLSAGGVDYLPKPFRPKEAIARLRVHLQIRIMDERQKKLLKEVSQANTAKNRFLGMAAHDLRNPLASVRGLAEFLLDGTVGTLTADQLDLVKNIHEASQGMLEMVNELLDVSVIEAGELNVVPISTSLIDLLEKSVTLNGIHAAKKGTKLQLVRRHLPTTVKIDAQKIKQVLDNLISNAVKFSPPGSTVTVKGETEGSTYSISVLDEGPGIPKDELHKLFKDFGRTSVLPTGGEKSTGLGLAICRKIIEAHQGTITVQNAPAGGCEFKFSLSTTL